MIESLENTLQIAVLLLCAALSLLRAAKRRSRTWTLLFFFYGSFVLGDIYWLACLLFFDRTPQISVVSDLSWYASYLFLYLLLRQADPPERLNRAGFLPWLGPVFTAGMAVFFTQYGQPLNNLIYAALMGLLLFAALRRLTGRSRQPEGPSVSDSPVLPVGIRAVDGLLLLLGRDPRKPLLLV